MKKANIIKHFSKSKIEIINKKNIIKYLKLFLVCFVLYYFIGIIINYMFGTAKYWNVLFDFDTPRVVGDLSLRNYNHYRIAVHPLLIIMFQPIILFLNIFFNDAILSITFIQAILGALSCVFMYNIFNKIHINYYLKVLLIFLFSCSFSQIIFSSVIETYIFAEFFLILSWLYYFSRKDNELLLKDYIILVILGLGCMGITITNFIQFLIMSFFLIVINNNYKRNIVKYIILTIIIIAFSVLLSDIQKIIWPSAPNYFTKLITDFFNNTSEEKLYISHSINTRSILNVINSNYAYNLYFFKLIKARTGAYIYFENSILSDIFSIILFCLFVLSNILFLKKEKMQIKKHKTYFALLTAYSFNFILHLFYGNSIAFLYVAHYYFLILIIIAYIFKYLKININKKVIIGIINLLIILMIISLLKLYNILDLTYSKVEYFRKIPLVILTIFIILIWTTCMKKKKILYKVLIIITLVSFMLFYVKYNNTEKFENDTFINYYQNSLLKYKNQLKDLKNEYLIQTYEDRKQKLNIYFFGMASKNKYLYKEGKLYDIKTQEIKYEFEYDEELIIPNEYTVILKNQENYIKIYENEKGTYIDEKGKIQEIDKKEFKINLPNFSEYKYSEILKNIHQEILFNFDGDIPKPNVFGYSSAWYRDTMLATMVLERTENMSLIDSWLKKINNIYDNSRDTNIDEADNLGELLYIIGASNIERKDLVKNIIQEINRLKNQNNYFCGLVDGINQCYYPTVLAIFGANKFNINLNLTPPQFDDGYAKLTWYTTPIASNNHQTSKYYPYINWAFYHYSPYETLYLLDEFYPLTYEGGENSSDSKIYNECIASEFYCEKQLYLSHLWHASEIFLLLTE